MPVVNPSCEEVREAWATYDDVAHLLGQCVIRVGGVALVVVQYGGRTHEACNHVHVATRAKLFVV